MACKELAGRVVSASRARGLPRRSFASGLGGHAQAGRLPRGLHRGRAGEQVSRKASLLRRCALPAPKTFDGYNWSAVSWPGGFGRDELLFQVVSEAYESQSVVITTNLEFSRWGQVFGDDQMAAAVIDRVVHHGRLLRFRGESYRVRNALMQQA